MGFDAAAAIATNLFNPPTPVFVVSVERRRVQVWDLLKVREEFRKLGQQWVEAAIAKRSVLVAGEVTSR